MTALSTKWTSQFFATLGDDRRAADELKDASVRSDLARWTSTLTGVVVRSFEQLGWAAAGKGHRSGMDAMMLAAAVPGSFAGRLADLGAGAGAAGLAVASRCRRASTSVSVTSGPWMRLMRSEVLGIALLIWRWSAFSSARAAGRMSDWEALMAGPILACTAEEWPGASPVNNNSNRSK
jgi:hypothetical protein